MKKIISLLLCFCVLFSVSGIFACANEETDAVGDWNSVSYHPTDRLLSYKVNESTTYKVSAKGNQLEVAITSDYINGDKISCGGTKGCYSDVFGADDGIFIFYVTIKDNRDNDIRFLVRCDCGENSKAHTMSLKKDGYFLLQYCFHNDDNSEYLGTVGSYFDKNGKLNYGGYRGSMSDCYSMNISSEGHTLKMTTTLPSEIVDYKNEGKKALNFNSDSFTVSGESQGPYHIIDENDVPEESKNIFEEIVEKFTTVMKKFFDLLKRFFSFAG